MTTDRMVAFSFRRCRRVAVLAVTTFAFFATSFVFVPQDASAQERRTLLEFFFGRRKVDASAAPRER